MPSAIDETPYVNKAPLFFCRAGDKENCTEALKQSYQLDSSPQDEKAGRCRTCGTVFSTNNKLHHHLRAEVAHQKRLITSETQTTTTWPQGGEIRVKILPGHTVLPGIKKIIETVLEEWKKGLNNNLIVKWVGSSDEAEIRISFRNDQTNWSALGARAVHYGRDKATMNFSFGGWKEKSTIFSYSSIARAAAHLFGHALGLPHATIHWSSSWNQTTLDAEYGSFWSQVTRTETGSSQLQSSQSIMAYDRPGRLSGNGSDEKHGGSTIDPEAYSMLQTLYPAAPSSVHHSHLVNSQTSNWRGGIGAISATKSFNSTCVSNVITGLTRLDMGINGNFRLTSFANDFRTDGFNVVQGCWDNTHIIDASCDVMSFASNDTRIQTGREEYGAWKTGADVPGRPLSRRINFAKPWKKTPAVLTWISGLDYWNGSNVRCEVAVSGVDVNGFTLHLNTWADSIAYNIQAGWLAHEVDDYTIRSGYFDTPHLYPNTASEYYLTRNFSSPMRRRPQAMFHALTYIDIRYGHNLRFNFEVDWNASQVTGKFSTWEQESEFYCLRGCYIGIL